MDLTGDAKTLWAATEALARTARPVSRDGLPDLPPMLFFTDPVRTPEPWRTAERLPAGAAVVYRTFGTAEAEAVARRLRGVTADRGVRLLIGLDADLARRVGADGLHLPERAAREAPDLKSQNPGWLLTAACHDPMAPVAEGLDALILSPIFPAGGTSASKSPLGVEAIAVARRASGLPVYALGGISAANVGMLANSGACGLAAVDAIQRAFAE